MPFPGSTEYRSVLEVRSTAHATVPGLGDLLADWPSLLASAAMEMAVSPPRTQVTARSQHLMLCDLDQPEHSSRGTAQTVPTKLPPRFLASPWQTAVMVTMASSRRQRLAKAPAPGWWAAPQFPSSERLPVRLRRQRHLRRFSARWRLVRRPRGRPASSPVSGRAG